MNKEVVIINQTYDGMSGDVNPVILEWDTLPEPIKKNVLEAAKTRWNAIELYEYNHEGEHDISGHLESKVSGSEIVGYTEIKSYKGEVPLGEPVRIKHIVEFRYSE